MVKTIPYMAGDRVGWVDMESAPHENVEGRTTPKPLPLGEVAVRSTDGEGEQKVGLRLTDRMEPNLQVRSPSQPPSAPAPPEGELFYAPTNAKKRPSGRFSL